jgi:hypothetical protein
MSMSPSARYTLLYTLLLTLSLPGTRALAWMQDDEATTTTPPPQPITLDDLKAPSSPAFVLLGVEPTSVERPETPKALIVDLVSTLQESQGIPKDYALALAPYWLKDHPDLTYNQYFTTNPWQNLLHTLSISLASHRPEDDQETDAADTSEEFQDPAVGIGFRGMLIGGRAPKDLDSAVKDLEKALGAVLDCENDCEEVEQAARDAAAKVQEINVQRVGFTLDVAGGAVWDFPEEKVDQRRMQRWGAWITPAYRFASSSGKSSIDALAVLRYIRKKQNHEDTIDLGGRLIWHYNDDLALSAEYVQRRNEGTAETEAESTDRLVGLIEYRLTDNLFLVASYGEDFAMDDEDSGTLVSTLGLKFGLGKKEKLLSH